jgi:transcriptional activator SPT7
VQSDALLANGLPPIQVSSSKRSARKAAGPSTQLLPPTSPQALPALAPSRLHKPKSRHKTKYLKAEPNGIEAGPLSLVSLINSNIKTMKRVRHTHGRFAALVANANAATGADESIDGTAPGADGFPGQMMTGPSEPAGVAAGSVQGDEENLDAVDDKVDQRPWLQRYIDAAQVQDDTPMITQHVPSAGASSMKQDSAPKVKKKSKRKRRSRLPIGIDMGEETADSCVRWMGEKVLEHVGFQGKFGSF